MPLPSSEEGWHDSGDSDTDFVLFNESSQWVMAGWMSESCTFQYQHPLLLQNSMSEFPRISITL